MEAGKEAFHMLCNGKHIFLNRAIGWLHWESPLPLLARQDARVLVEVPYWCGGGPVTDER